MATLRRNEPWAPGWTCPSLDEETASTIATKAVAFVGGALLGFLACLGALAFLLSL